MIKPTKRIISVIITLAMAFTLFFSMEMGVQAKGIPSDDAFSNLSFTEAFRVTAGEGTAQSMVATNDYIIVIENIADDSSVKDVVTAYYRNDKDSRGVPVEQYSVALRVQNDHLERGNGLAYNPVTNLIYVAPSTCYDNQNYGHILVMDPATLTITDSEFLTYGYGINGISYNKDDDTYVVQGNHDNQYGFSIYDANLDLVSDLGAPDIYPGYAPQDFCVCGDYIIGSPAMEQNDTPYLNIYSISRNTKVTTIQMNIPLDDLISAEPQSVTELNAGQLLVMVNETNTAGERYVVFYETKLPYNFTISTTVSNGTISETASDALRGSDYTVKYQPNNGFALSNISIDGVLVNPDGHENSYTFTNVDDNHNIIVTFGEKSLVKKQTQARNEAYKSVNKLLRRTVKREKTGKGLLIAVIIIVVIALLLYGGYTYRKRLKTKRMRTRHTTSSSTKNRLTDLFKNSSNKRKNNRERNLKTTHTPRSKALINNDDFGDDYDDDYYSPETGEIRIPKGMRDINSMREDSNNKNRPESKKNTSFDNNSVRGRVFHRRDIDSTSIRDGSVRRSDIDNTSARDDSFRRSDLDNTSARDVSVRRRDIDNTSARDVSVRRRDIDNTSTRDGAVRRNEMDNTSTKGGSYLNKNLENTSSEESYMSRKNRDGESREERFSSRKNLENTSTNDRFSDLSSVKKRETRNMDHFYREENKSKTLVYEDVEEDIPVAPWPDELSDNLVGHWQDGVWVTTRVASPRD